MKRLSLFCLLFIMLITLSAQAQDEEIQIINPWIRAAPPVAQTLAAYMTIKNPGSTHKTIQKITSPLFAKIEIHETVQHNGMTMMQSKEHLPLKPGSQILLAPGGFHMMLIAPQKTLQLKEQVPFTITFDQGKPLTFTAEVRTGSQESSQDTQHEHKHH